jgi:hypothetical protein
MKFCINCKYFRIEDRIAVGIVYKCSHSELLGRVKGDMEDCASLRANGGDCGNEAKYFEPRLVAVTTEKKELSVAEIEEILNHGPCFGCERCFDNLKYRDQIDAYKQRKAS